MLQMDCMTGGGVPPSQWSAVATPSSEALLSWGMAEVMPTVSTSTP